MGYFCRTTLLGQWHMPSQLCPSKSDAIIRPSVTLKLRQNNWAAAFSFAIWRTLRHLFARFHLAEASRGPSATAELLVLGPILLDIGPLPVGRTRLRICRVKVTTRVSTTLSFQAWNLSFLKVLAIVAFFFFTTDSTDSPRTVHLYFWAYLFSIVLFT